MLDLVAHPLTLGFMQRVVLASVLVGGLTALVGAYVVLKGLAFIGDAVSHAAFPGVVVAFMLRVPIYPGAVVAALLTALGIGWISRRAALRLDTSIGVLFAGAFAAGDPVAARRPGAAGQLQGAAVRHLRPASAPRPLAIRWACSSTACWPWSRWPSRFRSRSSASSW